MPTSSPTTSTRLIPGLAVLVALWLGIDAPDRPPSEPAGTPSVEVLPPGRAVDGPGSISPRDTGPRGDRTHR